MPTTSTTTGPAQLRKRTCGFACDARAFVRRTPRTLASLGDSRQLIKSSGEIGAAYIEADEAPSRQDFLRYIGAARKSAKLSAHWLNLLAGNLEKRSEDARAVLAKEAEELERVFGAIIGKTLAKGTAKKEVAA